MFVGDIVELDGNKYKIGEIVKTKFGIGRVIDITIGDRPYLVELEQKTHSRFERPPICFCGEQHLEKVEDNMEKKEFKIGDRVNENTFGAGTIVKTLNGEYMIKFDTENYQLAQSEYDKTNCYAWRTAEQLTPLSEEKHIKQNCDFCVGDNVYVLINEGKTKKYGKIIGKLPHYCYIKFDGQVEEEAYSYATVFHADEQPASDTFVSETVQPVQKESAENAHCKPDMVNHPPHYCQDGGLECIDVMQLLFGKQAVIDYCKCNIFKYRFRSAKKNGEEDIKKAQWYENKLNELSKK